VINILYDIIIPVIEKEIMLGCNKNYATLVFNCILKNSKGMISASGIKGRSKNNNIKLN